jgi:hypothetical protein
MSVVDERMALMTGEDGFVPLEKTLLDGFYQCNATAKTNLRWFLEKCTFSFTFEDFMMCATLFALFGDSAKAMSTDKWGDYPFEVADTICLFLFVFELFANTYCRSKFLSFWPLKFEGYIFSFFWFLDIIAIGCVIFFVFLF